MLQFLYFREYLLLLLHLAHGRLRDYGGNWI